MFFGKRWRHKEKAVKQPSILVCAESNFCSKKLVNQDYCGTSKYDMKMTKTNNGDYSDNEVEILHAL